MKKPHIIIQAIMEYKGCSEEVVESFIKEQLDAAKERGDKWTRTAFLKVFARPGCPTEPIIARLESEKKVKK